MKNRMISQHISYRPESHRKRRQFKLATKIALEQKSHQKSHVYKTGLHILKLFMIRPISNDQEKCHLLRCPKVKVLLYILVVTSMVHNCEKSVYAGFFPLSLSIQLFDRCLSDKGFFPLSLSGCLAD